MQGTWYKTKAALVLCLCMGLTISLYAQAAKIKKGNQQFSRLTYYKALKHYGEAYSSAENDVGLEIRLAETYRNLNDTKSAEKWFEKALAKSADQLSPSYMLDLVRAKMSNEHYSGALQWVNRYLDEVPNDTLAINYRKACLSYPLFLKDSSQFRTQNLAVNSKESDFGATVFGDQLIFSSARQKDKKLFGWNGRCFLQLYTGTLEPKSVEVSDLKLFSGSANTKFHEAVVAFSPDQKTIYFTRNNFLKGKRSANSDGTTLLKLYQAEWVKDKFKHVKELPFNSDDYSVGHPSLSADGSRLYFTSDIPGGYGGTDIYFAVLENGKWGKPQNLGPAVNTPGEEMFPWVSPGDDLYFASNGHPGLGGLDIFHSELLKGNAHSPRNMGAPINSSKDDFHLIKLVEGNKGYFSSNRGGGVGDDDIYSWEEKAVVVKGLVVDKLTQQPIEGAILEFKTPPAARRFNFSDQEGVFALGMDSLIPVEISAAAHGYQTELVELGDGSSTAEGIAVKIEMVRCGETETTPAKPPVITKNGPVVTVSGSLRDEDGNPVSNARVRIIREIEINEAEFIAQLEPGTDYIIEVESDEKTYRPKVFDITTNSDENADIPLEVIFNRDELPPGRVFYIIYYDFDQYNIRERDARPELDRVAAFMNAYPKVTVELTAHTDSRGTDSYNQKLSRNRAIEAFKYIASQGVSRQRLSYRWNGEAELNNECEDGVDCTEEDHQLNRRTEFKIKNWEGGFRSWDNEPLKP